MKYEQKRKKRRKKKGKGGKKGTDEEIGEAKTIRKSDKGEK